MASAGIRTDRFFLSWPPVQPSAHAFQWSGIDKLVGDLASHGIRALPFVWGSPSWVASDAAEPPVGNPRAERAWREFLEALVKRYGPDGSYWQGAYGQQYGEDAKPLPISSWQIWNEPNGKLFFLPRPSARRYAKLLHISHDAIRSVDPHAEIVMGGLIGYGQVRAWDFLSELYEQPGFREDFDIAALHPYGSDLRQVRGEIERVRDVMDTHDDQQRQIWLTELGWGSAPPRPNEGLGLNKRLHGQARLLSGAFRMIRNHARAWRIGLTLWFDWRDPEELPSGACSWCGSSGLIDASGDPKPAYHAFVRFAASN